MTAARSRTGVPRLLAGALLALGLCSGAMPAKAQRDWRDGDRGRDARREEGRRDDWRREERRREEWRHDRRYGPPPVVYRERPVYAPPPVYYGAPRGPGVNLFLPFGR